MMIRAFEERDQFEARGMILEGLGEHFGFIDESLNPDLDDIQAAYVSQGHLFLVAEFEGAVVGTAGLLFERPDQARIVRMSVRSGARRYGVATALFDAIVEAVRARSLGTLVVHTRPEWPDAMGFYTRHGFEQFDRDDEDVHLRRDVRGNGSLE